MFPRPKLYFVKVDVRAAYDTIQQDKLLQIVEAVLEEVSSLRATWERAKVSSHSLNHRLCTGSRGTRKSRPSPARR
jgi:hypothetical protein